MSYKTRNTFSMKNKIIKEIVLIFAFISLVCFQGFSTPNILVKGGGLSILDGDNTPRQEDGTAFGTQQANVDSVTRIFWILNVGSTDLILGEIDIKASAGTVTQFDTHYKVVQPDSTTIADGDSVSFKITYAPTSAGSHGYNSGTRAYLEIPSNDPDEAVYNFDIHGTCVSGAAYDCASGKVIFSHADPTKLYDVDYTNVAIPNTNLGSTGLRHDALAIHPTDNFLYMIRRNGEGTRNELWVAGHNNDDQRVGDVNGLNANHFYMAGDFDDNGYLYVKRNQNNTTLFKVDVRSLTATPITLSQSIRIFDMAYRSQDGLLYARSDQGTIGLVSINPNTGEVKLLGNNSLSTYNGMMASDDGKIYGKASTGQFFQFHIDNGSESAVSNDPVYNPTFHDLAGCGTINFSAQSITRVKGNGILIPDGDTSPNAEDGTAFGTQQVNVDSVTRTFWILNEGTAPLTIGTVDVRGSNGNATIYDTHYKVEQPDTTTIAPGDSTRFKVTYAPTAVGRHGDNVGVRALIQFTTSDLDGNFNYYIHGTCVDGAPIDCATGKTLMFNYVGSSTRLYEIDYSSLNVGRTQLLNTGLTFYGGDIHPIDKFIYCLRNNNSGNQLWTMGSSGVDEYVGNISGLNNTHAYHAGAFDANGYLYVKRNQNNTTLYKVDVRGLTATPITLSQSIRIWDLTYRPQDGLFYAFSDQGTIGLVTIHPATGVVTLIGNNGNTRYDGLYTSADGRIYGQATIGGTINGQMFEINLTNGSANAVSNDPSSYNISNLDGMSCGTFTFPDGPRATVKGNNILIPNGDTSPNAEDGTEFGTHQVNVDSVTNTFWILNEGTAPLIIGTVDIQGSNGNATIYDAHYKVEQPDTTTIAPGDSTRFKVTYAPTAVGRHGDNVGVRALIKFTTNSLDGDFDYYIHGTSLSGAPFDCANGKMILASANTTRLYDLDYTDINLPRTELANTGILLYGIGVNPTDNFIYGMRNNNAGNQLWVVGDDGQKEFVGLVNGLNNTHAYHAGGFDTGGNYYVKRNDNNTTLHKVDVRSLTATTITLSQSIRIYDMVYRQQDGLFYAVSDAGTIGLVTINPTTGEVILIDGSVSKVETIYSSSTGEIYGQDINNTASKLTSYDITGAGNHEIVTRTLSYGVSLDDGASCGNIKITVPKAVVKGNDILIPNGDTSPNAEDGTEFGTHQVNVDSVTNTFWILNEGTAPLIIGTVDIQGSNGNTTLFDAHYKIVQPDTNTIAPGDSTRFKVTYAPTAVGRHGDNLGVRALIKFTTNDIASEFDYYIHGTSLSGNPIDCSSGKMIMANGTTTQLFSLDYTDANIPNTNLLGVSLGLRLYGIGINPLDKFIYGLQNNNLGDRLWVVGDDGIDEFVGVVNGLNPNHAYLAGDFDAAGNYYVKRNVDNTTLWKVDVRSLTATAITLSQSIRIYDMSYNAQDGLFYAVSDAGTIGLVTINPSTGAVTLIGNNGATAYPTTYASSTGEVYGQATTGQIFQYNTTNASQIAYSNDPTYNTSHQDGASCGAISASTDLEITKVDDNVTAYIPGNKVTYTVSAVNNGPVGAVKAVISNPLPTNIAAMKWTVATFGGAYSSATGINNGAINDVVDIPSGGSIVYTVTITIPNTYIGNLVNTATITTPSNLTDSNPANNSKSDTDVNESTIAENCTNGIDDDGDGRIDCFDCDCTDDNACGVSAGTFFGQTQSACFTVPTPGAFGMKRKYSSGTVVTSYSTPAVGDIDGDGVPDIVAGGNRIQVFDGVTGALKFTIAQTQNTFNSGASIADIDRDGFGEIYFQANNRRLYKYDHNGNQVWQSAQQFGTNSCGAANSGCGSANSSTPPGWNIQSSARPSFADFDGDGQAEIYIGNEIFNAMTGARITRPANAYNAAKGAQKKALSMNPTAYDVLPDSYCADCSGIELICGNTVYAVNVATSTISVASTGPYGDGYTSVADWNGDGLMDVVVSRLGAGEKPYVFVWDPRTGQSIKKDQAGNDVAPFVYFGPASGNTSVPAGGIPSIADFDGDGINEIAIVGRNKIYIIESDLTIGASLATVDNSSETTCTAFDFEGDGEMEIVYRDEHKLRILHYTGSVIAIKAEDVCKSGTRTESPIIADPDADGEAEIVCTCCDYCTNNFGANGQIRVYERDEAVQATEWMPTRRVWNTQNYVPTWVNDNLTIPTNYQNKAIIEKQDLYLSQTPYVDCENNPVYPATADMTVEVSDVAFDDCLDMTGTITVKICNEDEEALVYDYKMSYYNGNPSNGGVLIGTKTLDQASATVVSSRCYTTTFEIPRANYDLYVLMNDDGTDPANAPIATVIECDTSNNTYNLPIIDKPVLVVNNPPQICGGSTADLTAASITAGTIHSNSLAYYTDAAATTPVGDPSAVNGGTYYMVSTATNGCTDTSSVIVTANNAPAASGNAPVVWLKADAGTSNLATKWEDQSGNGNHYTTVGAPTIHTGDTTSNYNPYINLIGGAGFDAPDGAELGEEYTIITVAKKLPSDDNGRIFDGHTGDYSWGYWNRYTQSLKTNGSPLAHNVAPAVLSGGPKMLQTFVRKSGDTLRHFVNGKLIKTHNTSASANGVRVDINNGAFGNTEKSDCRIYEVLIYNAALSPADLDAVEGYLMTKYRMGQQVNYLSSLGTTTYDVSSYGNNVIGLGKECYLHQKQSESSDNSAIVYMSSLAATNDANGGSVTNNASYLMLGHNNLDLKSTNDANSEVPPAGTDGYTVHSRLAREWKVTNTNFSDNYSLEIEIDDQSGIASLNDLCLLVDDDGDFTSGCRVYSNTDGITFAFGSIIIGGLGTSIIPTNSTMFITLGTKNPASILPVDLIEFKGYFAGSSVQLNWATLSEKDNQFFSIERSINGKDWTVVGKVDGALNSNHLTNYSFIDKDVNGTMYYYRIKQTDVNGDFDYSNTILVSIENEDRINISPNPSSGIFNINFNGQNCHKFEVYDATSSKLKEGKINDNIHPLVIDLTEYPTGFYMLYLYSKNGTKTEKIIIY